VNRFRARATSIIAKREYLHRIRSRSFIISTLSLPALLIIAVLVIGISLSREMPRGPAQPLRIIVVSGDAKLPGMLRQALKETVAHEFVIEETFTPSKDVRDGLIAALSEGKIDAFVWLDDDALSTGRAAYEVRDASAASARPYLAGALSRAMARLRLEQGGMPAEQALRMTTPVFIRTHMLVSVSSDAVTRSAASTIALFMSVILMISLVTYGAMVMRGVLEEKSTRIPEMMLCVATSDELMAGKILGIGAVGLTQVAIWIAFAATLMKLGAASSPEAAQIFAAMHLGGGSIMALFAFYILGYLLYSATFAALGAAFNEVDEAQQWTLVLLFPLLISSWLVIPITSAPSSPVAVIISMIPFVAPVLMSARIAMGAAPASQVILSLVLLSATAAATSELCARIYRVGILMYGKPPRVAEIIRWLRYS
jgi:ABC-2 type transport system permease protein